MQNRSIVSVKLAETQLLAWEGPVCPDSFLLTETEERRAAKFATKQLADRWRWMRSQVRLILAGAAGVSALDLPWAEDALGKPYLPGFPHISFNVSHSENLLLLGWRMDGVPVGVDIERPKPGFPWREIAAEWFCPHEQAVLFSLAETVAERLFYKYWTAKEALMKATGRGLSLAPADIELRLDELGDVTGFLKIESSTAAAVGWNYDGGEIGLGVWSVVTAAILPGS